MGSSSKILRGSETRMYWVGCMVGYDRMPRGLAEGTRLRESLELDGPRC
jgi:hypothetical protein